MIYFRKLFKNGGWRQGKRDVRDGGDKVPEACEWRRILWDEEWLNAGAVKRHLPSAANEGCILLFHSSHDHRKQSFVLTSTSFGSLLYLALDKDQIRDPKFDPRAQATVYVGHGSQEGRKCVKGYSIEK